MNLNELLDHPAALLVIVGLLAIIVMAVGHALYLAGIALLILLTLVGSAYFFGARNGNKPSNSKDSDSSSGPRT